MTGADVPHRPHEDPARPRVLVISASMGAGHDAVARELGARLTDRGAHTVRTDVLDLLPAHTGAALRSFYRASILHLPLLYAGIHTAFLRSGAGQLPGPGGLAALAEGRLAEVVGRERPDLVVPVFHLAAQLTGAMRAKGSLRVPSAVVVTDFDVHRQWLHPGNDLYCCLTEDAARTVRKAAGRPAAATGPLVASRFLAPAAGAERWRRSFASRAPGRPVVLLSAGAWGAGTHLAGTARLLAGAGYLPVVMCGGNARLRARLARVTGTVALGWEDDVPGLMTAADALVDNAAGQTALEALAMGLPVIGHRPIPGHGKAGVRRMAALGLTRWAPDPWSLVDTLDRVTDPGGRGPRVRGAAAAELFARDTAELLFSASRAPATLSGVE
ncbi:galactosyldiacylglycerol synthase [Streptomyces sp. NPDC046977]|uniref:MGDG synthase family glycosyltransferase n=1 Tax=Streptomyces sp. NPDC046977 TaxID=3154703 RepID=UPI0034051ED9